MTEVKEQLEQDSKVYKALLESTKAIPWKIDWASKEFSYIGPQIEQLLGWTPQSWRTLNEWAERMHPDDRDRVVNYCSSQSMNGVDHEADYRALCRDGSYLWIRDVVHVVRKDGEVEALIGFMFDIDERKRNEQELQCLRHELERLSYCDGLTGIANRRMLDQVLAREWASASRSGEPLSLVLVDVDYFKQYNDNHGHLAGDECLKKLATIMRHCAARPRDVVARYGGDEFVLVLPETDADAARKVARHCAAELREAEVAHGSSPANPWLSISIGIATRTPAEDEPVGRFINEVDEAMYRAKEQGRNRVAV